MKQHQEVPIRVLQVLNKLDRGGAEAMIMNLYREIDKTKIQFDFLVHSEEKGLFEDEVCSLGGHVYRLKRMKWYNFISYYNDCVHFFKKHPEIKIVHGHIGSCSSFYLSAANKFGKYTIAHSHSAPIKNDFGQIGYKIYLYFTRYIAKSLMGCSTEAGLARYGKRMVHSSKYTNFTNGIDLEKFKYNEKKRSAIRNEFNISDNTKVVGAVGRLTLAKNPERIYQLFKKLVVSDSSIKCLWVGTGELENKYRELIKKEGYSDRILMTGVRSDIDYMMQALDCMIFPSLFEGLPVTLIEAQASGLPCVISDTISKEIDLTELISYHSLNEDDEIWIQDVYRLISEFSSNRSRSLEPLINAGYDIHQSTRKLADFYISKLSN